MTGIEFIAQERKRQIEEGWSVEREAKLHTQSELAIAAMCYACPARGSSPSGPMAFFAGIKSHPVMWPLDEALWKPTPKDRILELAKAGALIAAEIDRLLTGK